MHVSLNSVGLSRFVIHQGDSQADPNRFADEVRLGLTSRPKSLAPKYFYDALGSQLFEAICLLPEYYLTRAETEIFHSHAADIITQTGAAATGPLGIVELGSGSSVKTRLLIEAILVRQERLHYRPIDISETILEQSAGKLLGDYPNLNITAHLSDYTQGLSAIARHEGERMLVLFLGSNIGNYQPDEGRTLLFQIRSVLRPGDGLLLGADLKKSRKLLEPAYNDSLGVTSAFNLNLLLRINRELDANFDLTRFEHRAQYNEREGRVEIYLVSRAAQSVEIKKIGLQLDFREGERIHTENSYKYDIDQLGALARATGFSPQRTWFDSEKRFSCNLWQVG
ncbi:MAG: L-histidine N(alpha)-methyltransferase [Blastocatellia bacterium]|nr:L-histidine N(alpha)-methyltransferase [Blastocatellia bacterium]